MKNKLQIFFLLISIFTYGQKNLKDFAGTFVFKEINFYEPLTRELTDTTINYYSFEINSKIEIKQIYYVKNDFKEFPFLKFKFIKQHDSLFINYLDPLGNKTKFEYLYPLNKRDTVNTCNGYKMSFDSTLNRKEIDLCNNDPSFDNTYLKDTTIKFKEYTFECYIIEQNYNFIRNQTLLKKRIFIDKLGLVPVYEEEQTFAKRKGRRIPTNKWVMTRQMKLISVD